MRLGSRDAAAGRSMPAVTTMRRRNGDSHHRRLYHLAVARPAAGGTDISVAYCVVRHFYLTFRTDMVVSGQTESRAEAWAAGTDMSASIAIYRKAGLCNAKEWHSTPRPIDILVDEKATSHGSVDYYERQGRSPTCRLRNR
jgi:hypothetical protein